MQGEGRGAAHAAQEGVREGSCQAGSGNLSAPTAPTPCLTNYRQPFLP